MSRLDFKRKREQKHTQSQDGANVFSAFVKKHSGILILLLILILISATFTVIALNPDYAAIFDPSKSETLYLDESTVYEMPYIAQENTVIKASSSNAYLCTKDKLTMVSSSGKAEWSIDVSLNKPILSTNGGYILAADRGGKNIYLINNGKILLQTFSPYNIINASVSSDGKFVIVADEPYYKGLVTVKNANDEEVFVYHSGNAYIIDATIGSDTNKLALAIVNASTENPDTPTSGGVMFFNLYETEPYKTHFFDDAYVTNVFRAGGGFMVVASNNISAFNADGTLSGKYEYGSNLSRIHKGDSGLVLTLESDTSKNLLMFDNSAKEKFSLSLPQLPNYISIDGDRVAFGGGSEINIYDTSGKLMYIMNTAKNFDSFILFDNAKRAAGLTALSFDILEVK